jgi:hypothetical protein
MGGLQGWDRALRGLGVELGSDVGEQRKGGRAVELEGIVALLLKGGELLTEGADGRLVVLCERNNGCFVVLALILELRLAVFKIAVLSKRGV